MDNMFYNVLGVVGGIFILFGFYRTSIGRWTSRSLWYELDNALGAGLLIIYQVHVGAYISSVLNVIWAVVALRGVSSIAERRGWIKIKVIINKPRLRRK
jgi:hypothetical protein